MFTTLAGKINQASKTQSPNQGQPNATMQWQKQNHETFLGLSPGCEEGPLTITECQGHHPPTTRHKNTTRRKSHDQTGCQRAVRNRSRTLISPSPTTKITAVENLFIHILSLFSSIRKSFYRLSYCCLMCCFIVQVQLSS